MAALCKGCGTRRDEWAHNRDAFISVHETCPGCARLEHERGNVPEDAKGVKLFLVTQAEYFANRDRYEQS